MSMNATIGPEVTTVVWDLDGTLLDSFGMYRDCVNQALRELGRPEVVEQIFRNNHHGLIEESIADVLLEAGQHVNDVELAQIIRRFYELDNAAITDVDRHLFADAVDLAERAHAAGKRQIVTTNRPHGTDRGNGSPRNLVANSRLGALISDVICSDDSGSRKPHREFLEVRFGSDLAELGNAVVVGDQFVDAEFARNIGAHAVLVTRAGAIAHLDRLGDQQAHVQIVPTLRAVRV